LIAARHEPAIAAPVDAARNLGHGIAYARHRN
jgi:hypothetical protein